VRIGSRIPTRDQHAIAGSLRKRCQVPAEVTVIRLHNVTKVYEGGTVAARDVSLDIQKGEFVFLVGASGSGKSTLIRLMLRQEPITRGQIWVAGKDITTLPNWKVPYLRRSIGTVFQDFKLLPNKTVSENIAFALEVLGRPRSVIGPQVEQVLELVGLADKGERYPRQLSGGEQQRVSVARAFVNRPPILLADEPTGNLDPTNSVGIMKLLDRINRTGTTIVMATHDHAIVDAMQRRVVALERGLVIRDQTSGRYDAFVAGEAEAPPAIDEGAMDEIIPDAPTAPETTVVADPAPDVEPAPSAGDAEPTPEESDVEPTAQTSMDLDVDEDRSA
jgi:cell division transport system ATP-binding protein